MQSQPTAPPTLIGFRFHHSPCIALSFGGGLYLSEMCLRRMCAEAGSRTCVGARAFRTALISVERRARDFENIRDSRVAMLRQCVVAAGDYAPVEVMEDGVRIRLRDHKWFVRSDVVRDFGRMAAVTDPTLFSDIARGSLIRAKVILRTRFAKCDPSIAAA